MTHAERLKRWLRAKSRLNLTCKAIADRFGIAKQTVLNWNCGAQTIPEARLKQLESMR